MDSVKERPDETSLLGAQEQALIRMLDLQHAIGKDFTLLQENKAAYNESVDQLSGLRQTPRLDPLAKLPPELWRDIIYLVACPGSEPRSEDFSLSINLNVVLNLTLVSIRWQQAILNTPLLWTCVRTRNAGPDSLIKATICTEFSLSLPLTICVSASLANWDAFAPIVAPHRDRIRRIHMAFDDHRTGSAPVFTDFLTFLHPLPYLTSINILVTIDDVKLQWILDSFPSLQNVGFRLFTHQLLGHNAVNRMKFVYIESRLVHIVVRKPPPLLEHIYIVSRINSSVEQDQVALDEGIPSTLEPLTWTTIEYFDRHCHLLWALIPRLTNLISLNILATFETLGGLFIRIHQLPVLQSLTVCAQVPPYLSKSFPAAANVQANRSIQNFGFQPDYSSEDSGFDGDAVARFYESLRQVMAKCLEAVKSMKITWFDVPLCSQILWHDTFPLLTDLDMAVHRIRSSNSLEKIPFSVRKLSFRGSIADWEKLSASWVEDLSLTNSSAFDIEHSLSDHSKWTGLRRLSIDVELNLLPMFRLQAEGSEPTTRFCKILAMDSRQFPSLESIAFRHFPEWDIFFIMLERRNLHHSGKVSPIEKIQLPSYYPRFLFTPMHDLICGNFPIRPSNYDLSVAGNTDVLGDKSISGCILCLRSLLACDEPPFPKLAFTSTASPATEISIYPTTDDEVLSTWEYRTKVWNDKWYKIMRTTRELECDLYYRYDLIQTITKDSCKGVC